MSRGYLKIPWYYIKWSFQGVRTSWGVLRADLPPKGLYFRESMRWMKSVTVPSAFAFGKQIALLLGVDAMIFGGIVAGSAIGVYGSTVQAELWHETNKTDARMPGSYWKITPY